MKEVQIDPKNQNKIKKRKVSRDADDRLRDLPDWLEEFTDILEDTELPASAHSSQDSDSERPTKVALKSTRHRIHTHFPKRPKLRSLLAIQNDKGSLQKTHCQSSTSGRQVWWLDNG